MLLEHPSLPSIEPILKKCEELAHTSGLQALDKAGRRIGEIKTDRALHRRFIRSCHYGFDLAQRQISLNVIRIEEQISGLQDQLRVFRSARDPRAGEIIELIHVLQNRQFVLRRLVDSILYSILSPSEDYWVMKHLSIEGSVKRIDPKVVARTIERAVSLNKSDRMVFNLVCDLTTGVQIGDLIQIDKSSSDKVPWKIVELKEGRINAILNKTIEDAVGDLSKPQLDAIQERLGASGVKQAGRMLRQRSRQTEIEKMARDDEGMSPMLNMKVKFIDERKTLRLDSILSAVSRTCEEAKDKGVGVAIVDDCLHLLAVRSAEIGGNNMSVAHMFYHVARNGGECLLNVPGRAKEELNAMRSVLPYFDLVEQNIKAVYGFPVFVWKQPLGVSTMDLVMGRVRVFGRFDFSAFFDLAQKDGISMTWNTKRPSAETRRLSGLIPGSPNAWSVDVVFEDGTKSEILAGFFRRVMTDLTPPRDLIKIMKTYKPLTSGQDKSPSDAQPLKDR